LSPLCRVDGAGGGECDCRAALVPGKNGGVRGLAEGGNGGRLKTCWREAVRTGLRLMCD